MNIERLSETDRYESMRGYFAFYLHEEMRTNPDVYCLTGDLGYGQFDKIKRDFPDRFINCGASEQAMMGVAVGLSLENKIPVVYSITPFLLYRAFETIRNYVNHERIKIILIGGGRNQDYEHDGFSHWSDEDRDVMNIFKNISSFWPEDKEDIEEILKLSIKTLAPVYINLRR